MKTGPRARRPAAPPPTEPEREPGGERLQKILARSGVSSRRAAEDLISSGRVSVNGEVVTQMGVRADPAKDRITLDGRPITTPESTGKPEQFRYILLNKPVGVVSTASDPQGRRTVVDLVQGAGSRVGVGSPRLYPVGRLDAESTGLVLLTNDGELTFRLTHPRYGVEKEYRAVVRGRPNEGALTRLRQGVEIEGEMTSPAKVDYMGASDNNASLRFVVHEGRKRQIRLMAAAVGHPVLELQRVRLGPLSLGELEPGKWRYLAAHEVHALRKAVKLPPQPQAPGTERSPAERDKPAAAVRGAAAPAARSRPAGATARPLHGVRARPPLGGGHRPPSRPRRVAPPAPRSAEPPGGRTARTEPAGPRPEHGRLPGGRPATARPPTRQPPVPGRSGRRSPGSTEGVPPGRPGPRPGGRSSGGKPARPRPVGDRPRGGGAGSEGPRRGEERRPARRAPTARRGARKGNDRAR